MFLENHHRFGPCSDSKVASKKEFENFSTPNTKKAKIEPMRKVDKFNWLDQWTQCIVISTKRRYTNVVWSFMSCSFQIPVQVRGSYFMAVLKTKMCTYGALQSAWICMPLKSQNSVVSRPQHWHSCFLSVLILSFNTIGHFSRIPLKPANEILWRIVTLIKCSHLSFFLSCSHPSKSSQSN